MKLTTLLETKNLEHSLLIGYYGGGNYGDELLLEVLGNMLKKQGIKNCTITYHDIPHYNDYHHDFGYDRIDIRDKKELITTALKNKNILIGGGGLWGVDMNFNTLLMSIFLFACRRLFGKNIYLLGVGYYNSTNMMGRIGAWFAGKAANTIIARDNETLRNFGKLNKQTYLDTDMAWHTDKIDLSQYDADVKALEAKLPITKKTLFITPRRAQAKHKQADFVHLNAVIGDILATNTDKSVILALLESEAKCPEEYKTARKLQEQYKNVRLLDFPVNPLALFAYFRKHQDKLAVIGPQFHIIITAHLNNVPFLPVVYDNKVDAMLSYIGIEADKRIPIKELDPSDAQGFVADFARGAN